MSETAEKKKAADRRKRHMGLGVVWCALFCDYLLMTVAIPIFPNLKTLWNVTDVEVGMLFSAKAAVQILSSPLIARVVDGWGLTPLILGLLVELVSSVGFTLSDSYGFWFGMRALQGVASAAILSAGFSHVQQLYAGDSNALGHAMGTVTTGIISGVMAGPPLGGELYEVGKNVPFFFCAGVVGAAVLLAVVYDRGLRTTARREADVKGDQKGDVGGEAKVAGGGSSEGEDEGTLKKICELLRDKHVLVVLGSLMTANAAISCLEAMIGLFLKEEHGMSEGEVGLMYIATALPSVLGSKLGGWMGNRVGRWKTILVGMVLQGSFYALGPKSLLSVVVVSMAGLGLGMGLVDGCAPAMLSEVGQLYHGGTGVVFTLQTAAIQLGFVLGPVGGAAIMQSTDFQMMSIVLGAIMVLYAPLLTINSGITDLLKRKLEEDRKREELAGTRTAEPPVAASQLAATLAAAGDA